VQTMRENKTKAWIKLLSLMKVKNYSTVKVMSLEKMKWKCSILKTKVSRTFVTTPLPVVMVKQQCSRQHQYQAPAKAMLQVQYCY
jgi:hypothetical protein